MNYSNLDIMDMMMKHTQDLRRGLSGEQSAATLATWHLEDARHEMLRDYYARQEEDDDSFTFDFTSEVKRK